MDNLNFGYGNSANLSNAGVVAGTTSTVSTTTATNAVINGKFTTSLGVQTDVASPVLDGATGKPYLTMAPGFCCSLVVGINSAGVLLLAQGTPLAIGAGVGAVPGPIVSDPQFPGLPQDFVALAYSVVRTAPSAAPWTPGAGAWLATGVVASPFQNVFQLPNRPQAS